MFGPLTLYGVVESGGSEQSGGSATDHRHTANAQTQKEADDSMFADIIHQLQPVPDPPSTERRDLSVSRSDRPAVFSHLFHQYLGDNAGGNHTE